ncbi:hypothetical protein ACGFNX_41665 [Streptomyces sp. NPDC048723]|uniref:hypothetical protein n=1 Tax=Streptomyces sp. NPDC048723 TaxID=3365589 RepID=UPI003717A575
MSPPVRVTPLQRVSDTEVAAWHQVVAASTAHDLPGVPAPDRPTDNAQDNTHMLAVNRKLDFRFHRSTHAYQLDLPST